MYPYFQKNRKPNPSNSSKLSVREASPADPLRQFLAENARWLFTLNPTAIIACKL